MCVCVKIGLWGKLGECALRGDLKGERKGFESVLAAASSLRLLAAGVDILIVC